MASKRSLTWSEEQREMDQRHGLFDAMLQPVVKLYRIDTAHSTTPQPTSAMADSIQAAACGGESPQAAKRMRLDTDHEDGTSARLLPSLDSKMFVEPYHANKVLEGLNRLRLNSALCDLILCCEGQEFPCHRYLLASFNPYFEAMCTSGMKESTQERVTISGVEPQTIGLLVSFAYTSKVSICAANVQALLTASNLWDVVAVQEACCDYMDRHMEDGTSAPLLPSLDAEMFEEPYHPNKVLEGLNRLRLNSALCDLILCCEGQEFPCHRYLLASFSPYFEAMFTSGMKETTQERVTISGVEPQTIGLLVSYAYTSKVSISGANVLALLAASNLWDITAVREACCDYMGRHMDTNNCVRIYCFADAHSCKMLEKHSMDYVLEHFSVVYQQEEFLSLSMERLTKILASDHLNVLKEDMAFEAAMLWLDKDPIRRQSFEKVLEQIRLPFISPSYLHTVNESLEVLKEHKGCQRFISEAKNQDRTRSKKRAKPCGTTRPGRTTVIVTMGGYCRDTYRYSIKMKSFDLLTNQWKTLGPLPRSFDICSVVMSGSTVYLASWHGEMWRYDVTRNSWLDMASMNETRRFFSLVMLDSYVYAVGGQGKDSMDRYDPSTNTWQLIKRVGVATYSKLPSVVTLDGLLYLIGGPPSSCKPNPAQVTKYNPETSVWTEVTPMHIPRDNPAVCNLNGKIYLIGGTNIKGKTENTMECYHPKTDQWSMCAPMEEPRCDLGVVVVDGKICVLGGRQGFIGFPNSIERYCEETNSWETVGQMPNAGHSSHYSLNCVSFRLRDDFPSTADDDEDDDEDDEDDDDDEVEDEDDDADYDDYDDDDDDERSFQRNMFRW